jgi:hypothetical protein
VRRYIESKLASLLYFQTRSVQSFPTQAWRNEQLFTHDRPTRLWNSEVFMERAGYYRGARIFRIEYLIAISTQDVTIPTPEQAAA